MRASPRGRDELVARVQQALGLFTKKEAEAIVNKVVSCIEARCSTIWERTGSR